MKILALLKQEVEEILIFSILPVLFIVILMGAVGYNLPWDGTNQMQYHAVDVYGVQRLPDYLLSGWVWLFLLFPFIGAGLGISQMRNDLAKKISVFLSTHATMRDQILTVRILVGLGFLLLLVLPVLILYLSWVYDAGLQAVPGVVGSLVRMFAGVWLLSFACYALGLVTAVHSSRLVAYTAPVVMAAVLILLVFIKGFGIEAFLLLAAVAAASLLRLWQKYTTMPL